MNIYEMTNFSTGEIFEGPFKTLWRIANSIAREYRRYNRCLMLEIVRPERKIPIVRFSGVNGFKI